MKHVMLDLETEGTRPGCVIRTISAWKFDPYTEAVDPDYFTVVLDTEEQRGRGLLTDEATLTWWKSLPENVQLISTEDPQPVQMALESLSRWWPQDGTFWANDPSFDKSILEHLFTVYGILFPWSYKSARCVRTIFELSNLDKEMVPKDGLKEHVGLDDALWQVRAVQMGIEKIGRFGSLQA